MKTERVRAKGRDGVTRLREVVVHRAYTPKLTAEPTVADLKALERAAEKRERRAAKRRPIVAAS